jgi:spermidine/putrescine transport system substrate-binding protein
VTVFLYSEYIDPDLVKEFQERTGIRVRLDVYETTEDMMAKAKQSPGQYDVIVVSDHAVPLLVKLNVIQALDRSLIPNAANVEDRFLKPPYDPDGAYSLPYQWGTVGLVYRKDRAPKMEPTWGVILDPARHPGPVVLMDSMRDMMAAALVYKGFSMNTRDPRQIRAAAETIIQAKSGKVLGFEGGVGGLKRVLAGEAAVAMVYNGDAIREADPAVEFLLPREGAVVWVDAMTVSAAAKNRGAAHAFINFILDGQVGARLSNFNRYATPNKAALALVRPEDRGNPAIYPPAEAMKKLDYLVDVGDDTRLYDEAWTRVKARQ